MWYWLILAGILIGLEMLLATIALLFAGVGALAAALIAYYLPDSLHLQISVFALASLAGVAVFWKWKRARLKPDDKDDAIGQRVEVVPEQIPGQLRVRYRGTEWVAQLANPATNAPVTPGAVLVIQGREGSILLVAPEANI
ncbi:MAG: NfeD family protein [Betaproteobacteria bacterium]|nr:NfeD family protein [Betaproteobacteria bacterium]